MKAVARDKIQPPFPLPCEKTGKACSSFLTSVRHFFTIVQTTTGTRRVGAALVFCLFALSLGTLCPAAFAQTGEWTWMSGSKSAYQNGVYGTLGVAAPANVPGARENATSWIDISGNLWFFGGTQNCNGCYWGPANDLWKYSPITGYWTWMSGSDQSGQAGVYGTLGVAAATNVPGARDSAVNWIDSNGNLWLFGGEGYDSNSEFGELNDLWNYNPSTGYWTWIGGSNAIPIQNGICPPGVYGTLGSPNSNDVPGGRLGSSNWTDTSGNLWLFGGYGCDSTGNEDELNDLWKFAPSIAEWTWVSGSDIAGQSGTYGTLGSANSNNVPGGRQSVAAWIDSSGNLWLFGGYGYDSTGNEDELNDLWRFSPSAIEWTWASGSKIAAQPGIYGTLGSPSIDNIPGGRQNATAWIDSSNNLWLFGGNGYDSQGNEEGLNDLWEFTPSNSEWTWMGGDSTLLDGSESRPGVYGKLGVASSSNIPGGRYGSSNWTDTSGNFWLFGGQGADDSSNDGNDLPLNDLWKYQFTVPTAGMPVFLPVAGIYSTAQSVTISDTTPDAKIYYTTDGSAPTTSSNEYRGAIMVSSSEIIRAIAVASGYNNSYVASATYTLNLLPTSATPVFDPPSGTYAAAQSVTISGTTPGATIYYTTDGSTPTTSSNVYSNPITVSVPVTIEAIAIASGYLESNLASATYNITQPAPAISSIAPLYASTGTTFTLTVTGTNFTPASIIYWGSAATTTSYVSSTELTAQVTASIDSSSIAAGWEAFNVTVYTAEGGTSGAIAFDVVSPNSSSFPVTFAPATAMVTAGSSAAFTVAFQNGALSNGSQCLNLPSGAGCVYNDNPNTQSSGTLTITTSSTTPTGTYVVTVACSETVPVTAASTATAGLLLPAILLPLELLRRKIKVKMKGRTAWLRMSMGLLLLASSAFLASCGDVSRNEGGTVTTTTSATSASTITLTVQ
jgi:N-acetylneuraminic acid mutarotase